MTVTAVNSIETAVTAYLASDTDEAKSMAFTAIVEWLAFSYEEEGHTDEEIDGMDLESLAHDLIRERRG